MGRPRINLFIHYSVILSENPKSLIKGEVASLIENDNPDISGLRIVVYKNHPRKGGVTARKV